MQVRNSCELSPSGFRGMWIGQHDVDTGEGNPVCLLWWGHKVIFKRICKNKGNSFSGSRAEVTFQWLSLIRCQPLSRFCSFHPVQLLFVFIVTFFLFHHSSTDIWIAAHVHVTWQLHYFYLLAVLLLSVIPAAAVSHTRNIAINTVQMQSVNKQYEWTHF